MRKLFVVDIFSSHPDTTGEYNDVWSKPVSPILSSPEPATLVVRIRHLEREAHEDGDDTIKPAPVASADHQQDCGQSEAEE